MKKLMVYLDEDFHESLKTLALKKKTTMAALVRYAIDATFEDDLDAIAGQRAFDEYLRDPSSAISLEDLMKERGIVLPNRSNSARKQGPQAATG
jgi:hypothetical protein